MKRRGHEPVLVREVLKHLDVREDGIYVDATVGAGGHALEIAKRLRPPRGRLLGLDVDPDALEMARDTLRDYLDRAELVRASYTELERVLDERKIESVDGALFDFGLSSLQLADPARGFSFQLDAPLDMRFDLENPVTARAIVNTYSQQELARILREHGEERWAGRIAAEIVRAREREPIETTGQLVEIVLRAVPKPAQREYWEKRGIHPATRTFQALRIAVNRELENIETGLEAAFRRLRPGGRLVAISFHSLEDRIVKRFMREKSRGCLCPPEFPVCQCSDTPEAELLGKATPSPEEISRNPRARSARLRALRRL
jgi:16S rRNA (cytosine1402-N4)-methyltransferase